MAAVCGAFVRDGGRDLSRAAGPPAGGGFPVFERRAAAAELVVAPEPTGRLATFCYPDHAAVVLGSSQPLISIDEDAVAGYGADVVRRRSGGGAVFVAPGAQVWLDLFVPVGDPLYELDVSRAARFVGALWMDSLVESAGAGVDFAVHAGPLVSSPWSRLWCFSGLGPGEVSAGGRKLVGVSQRRSRAGAWFFTMACSALDPERDAAFLRGPERWRRQLADELKRLHVPLESPTATVESRLAANLARL